MPIVEVQLREDLFLAIVEAELLRVPLPSQLITRVGELAPLAGEPVLVERVDVTSKQLVEAGPTTGPVAPGQLLVKVELVLHTTTPSRAKAAGHLGTPATFLPIAATLYLRLRLTRLREVELTVVESEPAFQATGTFPLGGPLPLDFTSWAVALLARDGVVVARVGTESTDAEDLPGFRAAWMGNRLGAAHWGLFAQGDVFSHSLARQLQNAVDPLVAASSDPELEVTAPTTKAWVVPGRRAGATAHLNAVDAGPLDIDGPFRIEVTLVPTVTLSGAGGAALKLDTRIQWIAEDLLSDLGIDVVQDTLNDALAAALREPPDGQVLTGQGEDFVTFTTTRYLEPPRSRTVTAQLTEAVVEDAGLALRGTLQVRPRPGATWSVELPTWGFSGECRRRSVVLALSPPTVQLLGTDPYVELYQRLPPSISAQQTWDSREERSLPGALPVLLTVELSPAAGPFGAPPTGALSVCLCTNMGVRWVDFGLIPAKPSADPRELQLRTALLISRCMAISDRWGMGKLNLGWLVDPPDLRPELGRRLLHQWRVRAQGVEGVEAVELFAVGPGDARRPLGHARVVDGMLDAHAVTDANESLELTTGREMRGPAPQALHRWLQVWRTEPADGAPPRARQQQEGEGDGRSVEVLHRGARVLAVAGRFEPVESADQHLPPSRWRGDEDRPAGPGP